MANAQESTTQPLLQDPVADEPSQIPPTPTIYMGPPQTIERQATTTSNNSIAMPTPTIYIAPTVSPTAMPSPTPTTAPTAIPTATPTVAPTVVPTVEPTTTQPGPTDLESLFSQYSSQYGVSEDELKKIAQCESGFNTNSDTGTYAGMFQFSASTWASERNTMGLDPNPDLRKDAGDAIQTTAYMLSKGQENAWPNCH